MAARGNYLTSGRAGQYVGLFVPCFPDSFPNRVEEVGSVEGIAGSPFFLLHSSCKFRFNMNKNVSPLAEVSFRVEKLGQLIPGDLVVLNGHRLLKADVETFILEEAETIRRGGPVRILIHTLDHPGEAAAGESVETIRRHFSYRASREKYRLDQSFRTGWSSLMLGVLFLVLMYSLAIYFIPLLPEGGIMISIREVFIILGWVALWRPAELLLYDWIPIRRRLRLYERLAASEVEIKQMPGGGMEGKGSTG